MNEQTKDRIAECGRRCEQALVNRDQSLKLGWASNACFDALDAQDESLFAFELARQL